MIMAETETLNNVITVIDDNTRNYEEFLSVQDTVSVHFQNATKQLYDFTKEQTKRNTNALPELLTDGFDEEQIWQQLELQNEGELAHFLSDVSKLLAGNKTLTLPISPTKPELIESKDEDAKVEGISSMDQQKEEEEEEEEEEQQELKSSLKKAKRIKGQHQKRSIVDDKFFKLQELDEYLTKEERKEKQIRKDAEESDEDKDDKGDGESLDLFNDISEDEGDSSKDGKFIKYADFFDNPNSEDEGEDGKIFPFSNDRDEIDEKEDNESFENSELEDVDEDDTDLKPISKKVKFNLTNDSDETDSLENKIENKEKNVETKSSLEARQERLQTRIQQLEEEALAEKPWQLKGEVNAALRPPNSLLEEYVEFDVSSRPPPIITEQTTFQLEDIIKQRIKDKAWDDVEKKFKPVETPLEYKKKLILNQEKSKESLSQIYENEYLKQKQALNPETKEVEEEEPKAHVEIREMMESLFSKLNALSNFHYTPRLVQPEIKIISNVPAINMEEVAPVATSDATLLAPEEVQAKSRGDIIGKSERTITDMKRERRKKKLKQKERQKDRERKEQINSMKPRIDKKYKKNVNLELMKKLSKDRNITTADETMNKVAKSSSAFFSQLQDQVKSHIKSKVNPMSKDKNKKALSAAKLKL
ncbi:PREDICTED: U3 small nucleolar ribonucleoprotein protein MPP10 [Polistes canadensis]|uniref:U3 small nucleolar ribonucleoprotein protein MPP10 n=1 Tax=Polistes canadensis TaxID=91411 RepID=UPI000718E5C9|nr:PREDICTED: U3 small nucleolar ribonucleoprotein protein MPP10 [Polistes canadensis]